MSGSHNPECTNAEQLHIVGHDRYTGSREASCGPVPRSDSSHLAVVVKDVIHTSTRSRLSGGWLPNRGVVTVVQGNASGKRRARLSAGRSSEYGLRYAATIRAAWMERSGLSGER